ncbi:hypothetical protein ABC337_17970 [Arthrobacter sp. 1P04PC]|uniref:hypothetical protein n=1 Tax=unclassified Arthrobacter TaxID=235627 RepID=UPI0039A1BC0B
MVEKLWSYWSVGLWMVGIMLIVYLVFRKSNIRRVALISLLVCAAIYGVSWAVYASQMDLPVRTEGTALGARTTDVGTILGATFGMLFSFYGFLGMAAIWAAHEVLCWGAQRRTPAATK